MIGLMPPAMMRQEFIRASEDFDKYVLEPSLNKNIAIRINDLEDFSYNLEAELSDKGVAELIAQAQIDGIEEKEILDSLGLTKKLASVDSKSISDLPQVLQTHIIELKKHAINFLREFTRQFKMNL